MLANPSKCATMAPLPPGDTVSSTPGLNLFVAALTGAAVFVSIRQDKPVLTGSRYVPNNPCHKLADFYRQQGKPDLATSYEELAEEASGDLLDECLVEFETKRRQAKLIEGKAAVDYRRRPKDRAIV